MKKERKTTFWFWLMRAFLLVGSFNLDLAGWLVNRIRNKKAVVYRVGNVKIKHTVADVVQSFADGIE